MKEENRLTGTACEPERERKSLMAQGQEPLNPEREGQEKASFPALKESLKEKKEKDAFSNASIGLSGNDCKTV